MRRLRNPSLRGITLIEVVVSVAVLALTTVITTQSMLILNRNSNLARAKNLAKAYVLGKVNEVAAVSFQPTATTPVIPTILNTGTTTTSVQLGNSATEVGTLPATLTWTVANVGTTGVLSIDCKVTYTLMNKSQSYEVFTFRAPD